MSLDISYIERSESAKLIVEYCEDLADELNLELVKTPYWGLPIIDTVSVYEYSDLIIETSLGSTKVKILRKELEEYPGKVGNEEVKGKIRGAFKTLMAKTDLNDR